MFTLINQSDERNSVYRIRRHGKSVTIRYGQVGSVLRQITKSFETVGQATGHAIALWNARVDGGYATITAREWYSVRVAG